MLIGLISRCDRGLVTALNELDSEKVYVIPSAALDENLVVLVTRNRVT